ncbi:MAG: zinc transporter ZupT [Rikenellaceae bacterium]
MELETHHLLYALVLTLFAGLATGIGSLIALVARRTNKSLLAFSLGLSAGVMIYVSFVELFAEASESLSLSFGEQLGALYTVVSFFGGVAIIGLIDFLVPSAENPHEMRGVEQFEKGEKGAKRLKRMGLMTALAIAIHNFPEGIATFATAYEDPSLGLAIAVAVAIHNIPEGIAVSVPIYYSTGSRKKAFWYSLLSGLAEPLGGLMAYLILMPLLSEEFMGVVLAAVAGIMVYISVDELLPAAHEYGREHTSILGFILGMAIMAISLILLI